ncbi:MAG: M50 family metallopeptidase [Candidatus Altiarchaeota archaeon]|nr:M50 family metallopeptidase [Candidatus Altiarchaeota archaeon]
MFFALQILLNDLLESYLASRLKTKYFNLVIAPGTVIHEFSHALMAKITGCRITKISFFNPKQNVLGFVEYTQPRDGFQLYRNLLIGFAPFFGCGIFLIALFNYLAQQNPDITVINPGLVEIKTLDGILSTLLSVLKKFFEQLIYLNLSSPLILLILYLEYSISLGSAPSSKDFKDSFHSITRYKLQTLTLILLLTSIILLTGYLPEFSLMVLVFKWIILLLMISSSLLLISIPLAYFTVNTMEIRGIYKIIPVLSFILIYFSMTKLNFPREVTFISSLIFFLASLFILRHPGFFIKPK